MTLLAVGAAVIALVVARWFFLMRAQQMQSAAALQRQFYRSAEILAEDEGTPEVVLHMLSRASADLESRVVVWAAAWRLLRGHVRDEAKSEHFRAFRAEVEGMRPEMRKHLALAVMSAVFRVTYNNLIVGTALRRLALFGVQVPARAADAEENAEAQVLAIDMFDRNTCPA
jgi:hypothetical protein